MRCFGIGWIAAAAIVSAAPTASAQKMYVNGVDVTGLIRDQTFENATVRIDAQGNVHIDAPEYNVQLVEAGGTTTGATSGGSSSGSGGGGGTMTGTSATTPVYSDSGQAVYTEPSTFNRPLVSTTATTVATTTATTSGGRGSARPGSSSGGTASSAGTSSGASGSTATTGRSPLTKRYFLITQGTGGPAVGETIRVNINGALVREIDSAATQIIDDITDQVRLGTNSVTMMSTKKQGYIPGPSSAMFQVIIGEGHVESGGRVVIDLPVVTYTRNAADATAASRTYSLDGR